MTAARAIHRGVALAVACLALTACVSPSRTDRDYQLKAGSSAKAVASSVATAQLGARAAQVHHATGPYLSVLLGGAEKDALSVQATFDSVQPPSSRADQLREELDALLASATDGLAKMRILCRRGQLDQLPAVATALTPTLTALRDLADRYQ